jgi:hypothetical protein
MQSYKEININYVILNMCLCTLSDLNLILKRISHVNSITEYSYSEYLAHDCRDHYL